MKASFRLSRWVRGSLIALAMLVPLGAPALATNATPDPNNFTFESFEGDYYLTRDAQNQSHLRVQERLVARFPAFNQNHGILRALPKSYNGHSVNLRVSNVVNGKGEPVSYSKSTENGNLVLKIGDPYMYVHNRQVYIITYELDYATETLAGHDAFIWDVNGDDWAQSFDSVTARVHLDAPLAAATDAGHHRCFTGSRGSTASDCTITEPGLAASTRLAGAPNDATIVIAATRGLTANETLTLELGFDSGTFAAYKIPPDVLAKWAAYIFFLGILPIGLALWITLHRWWRYGRDPKGRGVIVPEYLPPKDLSVLAGNAIIKQGFEVKAVSATILDLAVRHYLKIYELKEPKLFKDQLDYELELIRHDQHLRLEETKVLDMLFGPSAAIGSKVKLSSLSAKLYKEAAEIGKQVNQQLTDTGYFRANPEAAKMPFLIAGIILGVVGLIAMPYSLGLLVAGLICVAVSFAMPARTAKGVEANEYLLGLKHYMTVAEAERLKVLQGPHSRLTDKVDIGDRAQLVKLYEQLLPYALLFGIEKAWAKEFAHLYDQEPDWYHGTTSFNAGYFAGSLAHFGTQSTTSFSPPASSSGGGSAGGGGGGGGGGGW